MFYIIIFCAVFQKSKLQHLYYIVLYTFIIPYHIFYNISCYIANIITITKEKEKIKWQEKYYNSTFINLRLMWKEISTCTCQCQCSRRTKAERKSICIIMNVTLGTVQQVNRQSVLELNEFRVEGIQAPVRGSIGMNMIKRNPNG